MSILTAWNSAAHLCGVPPSRFGRWRSFWLALLLGWLLLPGTASAGEQLPARAPDSAPALERVGEGIYPEVMRSSTGLELLRTTEEDRTQERKRDDTDHRPVLAASRLELHHRSGSALLPPRVHPTPPCSECFPYFPTGPPAAP